MIKPIRPPLRHRLRTRDWPYVMGLAKIVPSDDLCYVDRRAVLDEQLPTFSEEPVVRAVNEVFVVSVRSVMLSVKAFGNELWILEATHREEPRRNTSHI